MSRPTSSSRIYLDHNATTPPSQVVLNRLSEWAAHWGNPSSIHWDGRGPKNILRDVRQKVAQFLNIHALEMVFTSGGSESNNTVLKGVWEASKNGRTRIIASEVEHPSIMKTLAYLKDKGADVVFIPVDRSGFIDLDAYQAALNDSTLIVSVMYANNETGNIFPIRQMAELAHAKGALFHTDAVQALGKHPVDLKDLNVDYASFSAHKFYALRGAGIIYVKRGSPYQTLILGGGQERARRGGTENVLALAALGEMCAQGPLLTESIDRMQSLRDQFESRVLREITNASITGGTAPRLSNTSSLVLPGVDGESLLMNLDMKGFSVSTGAACSSGNPEPSPVLLSMGLSAQEAQASLRVSLGWETTEEQMNQFLDVLRQTVERLRSLKPLAVEGNYVIESRSL